MKCEAAEIHCETMKWMAFSTNLFLDMWDDMFAFIVIVLLCRYEWDPLLAQHLLGINVTIP